MSRRAAIALFCIVFSIPAIALGEEAAPADEFAAEQASDPRLAKLPPEVLNELEPETIAAILAATDAAEALGYAIDDGDYDPGGIIVPVTFLLVILLGVVSAHMLRIRKQAQLHQTLRLMIEKGTDIPPELFAPPIAAHSDLRRGLVFVGIGLSLLILIGMIEGFSSGSWAVGLIPAFIGVAYLIVWRYSQREEKS